MRSFFRWCLALTMGVFLLALVATGCGRSSLEPEDLDASASSSGGTSGTSGNTGCSPSTCSNGCCDSKGQCQTGRNTRTCGSAGGACRDCVAGGFDTCTSSRVCSRTVSVCDASSCPTGCCSVDDTGATVCLSGTEATACGRGGGACTDCEAQGRACDQSVRSCGTTRCDASNCSGCCVGDLCLPGNSQVACGANGGQCGRCNTGEVCRITSAGGGRCESTTTTCDSSNCGGCCDFNGNCQIGLDPFACGRLGQLCSQCGFGEQCVQDGSPLARTCQPIVQPTCGPGNCGGCCIGNTCVDNDPRFCGFSGKQCAVCGTNQFCNPAGSCEDFNKCSPDNCDGCCVGDICAKGTQDTACGVNGAQCNNCRNQFPAAVCQSGSCQAVPHCDQLTCPFGCCQGNTCVAGTQDTACGRNIGDAGPVGGGQCQNCTLFGQTCQGQQCVAKCNKNTCPNGCCQGNVCNTSGRANAACGQFGAQCDNCTARGAFCDGLIEPRVCSDNQKQCPAPYGNCPAGLRTEVTPVAQNVCSDIDLDQIAASCTGQNDDFTCDLAISQTGFACQQCVTRFNHPFAQRTGLFACAASIPGIGDACRRQMGCTTDCDETSCEQCGSSTESSCYTLVNGASGQCNRFASQTDCANTELSAGHVCSQFSYPNFSSWLREVTDRFCGDNK